jgi:hypothetical protein
MYDANVSGIDNADNADMVDRLCDGSRAMIEVGDSHRIVLLLNGEQE